MGKVLSAPNGTLMGLDKKFKKSRGINDEDNSL